MISLRTDFQTPFHKNLATMAWIAKVEAFVEGRIRSTGAFKTATGTGAICSRYNEDRFMGPLSVVKYHFVVEVRVSRGEPDAPSDLYEATLHYDPATDGLSCAPRQEHCITVEQRAKVAAESRQMKEDWIASLQPVESKEEFERKKCPVCAGKLRARFFPEGHSWSTSCAVDPSHPTSMWLGVRLDPGGWWTDFIADRTCPRCSSSKDVVGLLYGLIFMEVDPKVWEMGGCTFNPQDLDLWHCRRCVLDFKRGSREA